MLTQTNRHVTSEASSACCTRNGRWGWSPPDLPADSTGKRLVDRYLPRSGFTVMLYFAGVAALVNVAHLFPPRLDMLTLTLAGVAGGGWCAMNFWRCRHAHCLITGAGWLGLAALTAAETGLGHSVTGGKEPAAFLAILVAGLLFECGWVTARGTNVLHIRPSPRAQPLGLSRPGSGPGRRSTDDDAHS